MQRLLRLRVRDRLRHAEDGAADRARNEAGETLRPARIGVAHAIVVDHRGGDDTGSGPQRRRDAARNTKADEAGRARRHGAGELGLQGLAVTPANDADAEAGHDTRLESHPHDYNHSAPPPRAKLHTEGHRATISAPQVAIT